MYGENEIEHDASFITLCETARINELKLNSTKLQFKYNNCKLFGHKLIPSGLKVDEDKIEAIIKQEAQGLYAELFSFVCVF